MLHLFEHPLGRTEKEIIDEQIDIMVRAEEYGFDSVWPAEHHFREYGHCATPALTLAALAARTKKIRLGTGVVVLPLNHPMRVAEDYAFLDVLSNGRIDLGIGRGYQPHEYQGYGVDQTRSRDIFREGVEIIQKAWTEERFSYDGEFYQASRPERAPEAAPAAAPADLDGVALAGDVRDVRPLRLQPALRARLRLQRQPGAVQIEQYREALRAHGRDPENFEIAGAEHDLRRGHQPGALDEFEDGVMWYYHTFQKYVAPPKGQEAVPTFEMYTRARDLLASATWDAVVQGGAVVAGSPDQVVDRIGRMTETCGFTDYLCWTRIGGLDHAKVMRSMELMASKVMPQLRGTVSAAP